MSSKNSVTLCLSRTYATIQKSSAIGGAIKIDASILPSKTVKSPTTKKSITHAEYVSFYRNNPTMLILQHNNLTQAQLGPIRAALSNSGARLRVIRVKLFEHAIKVATIQDTDEALRHEDVNSQKLSIASKSVKPVDGVLSLTQLLSGPICTITFAENSTVEPKNLKQVLSAIEDTQNKLMLLGGRFDGQVFAIDSLDKISKLPGLETLRGQLLSLLGSPAVRLSQLLGMPGQALGRTMEGRKLALENENSTESSK